MESGTKRLKPRPPSLLAGVAKACALLLSMASATAATSDPSIDANDNSATDADADAKQLLDTRPKIESIHTIDHGFGKGDWYLNAGWFRLTTFDESQPVQTNIDVQLPKFLKLSNSFSNPGTSSSINNSDTVAAALVYLFTDHIGVEFIGGVPAKFEIQGSGKVQPFGSSGFGSQITTIDLGANNPLASAWQWSPTVLAQYRFFSPTAKIRPFIGVGVSYTWFTDVNLNPAFANQLNEKFGNGLAILAGKPGLATSSAQASSSWVPAYGGGVAYSFTRHLAVQLSASYLPLHTKQTITTKAQDGTVLMTNTNDYRLDPLVTGVFLSYHF